MFGKHPLGRTILGTPESVEALTKADVEAFISRNYRPEAIVFASVGSTPVKKLKRICEKYLSSYQCDGDGTKRSLAKPVEVFDDRIKQDTYQVHHLMGSLTVGADHPDKLPLTLLANYLGGPAMNSRLSMNIREKYGMAYHIEAGYSPYADSGVFSIYFGTDTRFHKKVERLVKKELREMCNKKLSARQLKDVKNQLIGQIALSQDSGTAMMTGLAKSCLFYNKVEPLAEFLKSIEAITAEDLQRVAQEFLHPKVMSHLVYLPS